MSESFIQFAPKGIVPWPNAEGECYLSPGTFSGSINSAYFPLPYNTVCTRLRFLLRGAWPPYSTPTLTAFFLINGEIVPDTKMFFEDAGDIPVVTRHQTVYPNVKTYPNDTVGIYIKTTKWQQDPISFYASAILNFDIRN